MGCLYDFVIPFSSPAWDMKLYISNYLLLSTYITTIKYKILYSNFLPEQAQLLQTWMSKNVIRYLVFSCLSDILMYVNSYLLVQCLFIGLLELTEILMSHD